MTTLKASLFTLLRLQTVKEIKTNVETFIIPSYQNLF